ncbi:uncharacterized protein LOC110914289 [Helianthus annuus]|uniref:uncharacterized protein LOC110914289 n=1 Tax=Helianthus annuus TaxID=4232 RepID=UPI00165323D8|nr:uncharacterized protein LOC110914289 [Helianthus annuus]
MYDIHYRYPAVEVLPFHSEDGQSIVYNDHDNLCDIVTDPTVKMTMFTEWMNCNIVDEFDRTLSQNLLLYILATVKKVDTGFGWYYMTCPTCSHEASHEVEEYIAPDDYDDFKKYDVYECSNYKCYETIQPVPKFKIKIEVKDNNDSISLILHHEQATQLFNRTAEELLKQNILDVDIPTFPKEIKSVVDKFFAFKIPVTELNLQEFDEVYAITAMSDDQYLISEIKKKFNIGQDSGEYRAYTDGYEELSLLCPTMVTPLEKAIERYIDGLPDSVQDIVTDYLDHGDQVLICEICSAKLWTSEGGKGRITLEKLTYSLCYGYGKVEFPALKDAHPSYQDLFRSTSDKSKFFLKNIRRYNSMFSFTSMRGKVDHKINKGNAPFIYRISGQNYHCMGSLRPSNGQQPKFSQLYIYDTENEITNRQTLFIDPTQPSASTDKDVDVQIIEYLRDSLDSQNMLVQTYRKVRDNFHGPSEANLKLRLIYKRDKDGRTYNLPSTSEVAALIVGDVNESIDHRDIVVETQSGVLQRISELHPSYLALQYPILFPYGVDGYRIDIPHRDFMSTKKKIKPKCTMREFFAYRIQDRTYGFSLILNGRRLLQQFLVDAYTMIESERLNHIRRQQKNLHCESFENLKRHKEGGLDSLSQTEKPVLLASSFTGGSRFMQQNYLDAMALCKWYGYLDFFITITCNPKWPEVKRFLKDSTIKAEDRPDILCRLFRMKLDSLTKDLKDSKFLRDINVVVYTVEFQKRGLPYAHICLFMKANHKLPTVDQINPFISAEIPDKDKDEDPELYSLVTDYMIHGPCGNVNLNCPCMVNKRCSKSFPKSFTSHTTIDSNGFPIYRRRDTGHTVLKSGVRLDNKSVIPYNKILLKRYQAHINVEWCNQAGSVKYLFKYTNKGPDRATAVVYSDGDQCQQEKPRDEIKEYYDCRYISTCEATWRIFSNEVHYRYPAVMRLPFHLPGQHNIVYGADDDIDNVLSKPSVASSMFMQWMELNENDVAARKLAYIELPF